MKMRVIKISNLFVVLLTAFWIVNTPRNGHTQQIRWLRTGELQSPVNEIGAEFENEFDTGNYNFFSWPAQYGIDQNTARSRTLWIGCRNFNDPVEGKIKSYKVVGVTARDHADRPNQVFEQEIKLIGKYPHPIVIVDDMMATDLEIYDELDEVDPELPCDRMVLVKFNTSIGVSVTKKVMAFGSSEHDNYFINDYVFKNTGIYNRNGDVLEQTLQDVWFYFALRYALAGVSCTGYSLGWGSWSSTWGSNMIFRSFGEDPNTPEFIDPSSVITPVMRGFFSWYGPSPSGSGGDPSMRPTYDGDWGCPYQTGDGTLGSAKYVGCATLHADKNSGDPGDDLYQPHTTWYISSDLAIFQANTTQYDEVFMADRFGAMSEGHPTADLQHYLMVDDDYPINYTDPRRQTGGGVQESQGFGPYTLAPGDSIHIVFAEGVSGLSWEKGREVGANWLAYYNQTGTPVLIMPDGSTTTEYNQYKRSWCETGQDSILKTFRAAKHNYESGYYIPQPPPPPDVFMVQSGSDRIWLSWSDNAESHPYFDGYVIYRSRGNVLDWTTVYDMVFECDAANVVHQFEDVTVSRGFNYYYYIQSKDDGTQNDIDSGVPLLSSKFYTTTSLPVHLIDLYAGDFQTHQSGDWNDPASWEWYNGSDWIYPAPNSPSDADNTVSILNGHTIMVTATDSADQVRINPGATLIIDTNAELLVKDGDGTDLIARGTLSNFGAITAQQTATIEFADGGKYLHKRDGGSIPNATWQMGSTCQFDSLITNSPLNNNQNFYNVIWNCSTQTSDLNTNWNGNTINGNIYVYNTGTARWDICAPEADSSSIITINGDIIQYDGEFSATGTDNDNTHITINHRGDIFTIKGNFAICRGAQGGTGTTTWNMINGNISLNNTTTQNSNSAGAKYVFTGNGGVQTLSFSGVTFDDGGFPVEVDSGATLNMNTSTLRGSGAFTLKAGATLQVAHAAGLDSILANTGTINISKSANYIFDGSTAQLTGGILPDSVGNLTINNSAGVTLSDTVTVNGLLELKKGSLSLGNQLLMYGANGSLKYSGATTFTSSDAEFPASFGPYNLTVANSLGLNLHASRSLGGSTTLYSKLILGANSLRTSSIAGISTNNYVVSDGGGILILPSIGPTQVLFPVGTSTAYAPVYIINTGTVDTISVSVVDDNTPAAYGGRVNVKWKISENTPGGGTYRLLFGWMGSLEDAAFQADRSANARIFSLADTTEPVPGVYGMDFSSEPYRIWRSGFTKLDSFAVGMFKPAAGIPISLDEIPTRFSLRRNHPNPFNPSTTFEIQVAKPGPVRVKVFDLLGREVTTLLNKIMKAGTYSITWDASSMPSGVYFYNMQAGNFIDTKKMVLLK